MKLQDFETGICAHCGEPKKEHTEKCQYCTAGALIGKQGNHTIRTFYDSGIKSLHDNSIQMFDALTEISSGKGRYNPDSFTHCKNTVEDMKGLALEAIAFRSPIAAYFKNKKAHLKTNTNDSCSETR